MSTSPFYIEPFKNCILVTLRGNWDMSTNIQYLAQLSDCLKTRKGRPFHLFVDMRGWQIPNSETFNQIKAPIKLDRRSQLSETWLEDDATDADHIVTKFFTSPSIKLGFELVRTQSISEFLTHCEEKADKIVMDYVRTWIGV